MNTACNPSHPARLPVSVIVLTYNEERNIEDCLRSICDWAGEVFVVDSASQDCTLEIARKYGAKVVSHPFETHARQWNWALKHVPSGHEWVLCLDADHRITPELQVELRQLFTDTKSRLADANGFYVKRRQVFRGRWIRHGGYYPKFMLKLVRKACAWCDENELLDFRFYVYGKTARLKHDLVEDNRNELDIGFWISKHDRFATLLAKEELLRRRSKMSWRIRPSLSGTPDQRTLWLKSLWYRLPLYLRPAMYFAYRYFLRLGFLDGKEGFIFHFFQAFWFRVLVDIKLEEMLKEHDRLSRTNGGTAVGTVDHVAGIKSGT